MPFNLINNLASQIDFRELYKELYQKQKEEAELAKQVPKPSHPTLQF